VNDALAQAFDAEKAQEQTQPVKTPWVLKQKRLWGKHPPGIKFAPEKPPLGFP